ncbi:hypothetical protein [Arthrobacter sp. NPDC056727]|uniref:hypothetical protein n=1 Tax=Arthrobacter sp. NPDC056727 TaxID=3345927 RepID=UPI00367308CE
MVAATRMWCLSGSGASASLGQFELSVQDKTSGSSSDFTAGAAAACVTSGFAADKAGLAQWFQ